MCIDYKKFIEDNSVDDFGVGYNITFKQGTYYVEDIYALISLCDKLKHEIKTQNDIYRIFWIYYMNFEYLLENLGSYACVNRVVEFIESENKIVDKLYAGNTLIGLVLKNGRVIYNNGINRFGIKGGVNKNGDYGTSSIIEDLRLNKENPPINIEPLIRMELYTIIDDSIRINTLTEQDHELINLYINNLLHDCLNTTFYAKQYEYANYNEDIGDFVIVIKDNIFKLTIKSINKTIEIKEMCYLQNLSSSKLIDMYMHKLVQYYLNIALYNNCATLKQKYSIYKLGINEIKFSKILKLAQK